MTTSPRVAFLCGFDRSGSSFVGGLLAKHPRISYACQPDNGTLFTRRFEEHWTPDAVEPEAEALVRAMVAQDFSFTTSRFFSSHSVLKPGAPACVIKTTKMHAKVSWLKSRWGVDVIALLRAGEEILDSLQRNGFDRTWYGHVPDLASLIARQQDRLRKDADVVLEYRELVADPNAVLNPRVIGRLGLEPFDFARFKHDDFTMIGESREQY